MFAANGLEIRVDPAGSRQIATTVRLDDYDFAFPSSSPAAGPAACLAPVGPHLRTVLLADGHRHVHPIVDPLTEAGVVGPTG